MSKTWLSLLLVVPAAVLAADPPDTVSADDAKKIISYAKAEAPYYEGRPFLTPGLDLEAGTAKVQDADLALRDQWLRDGAEHFKKLQERCKMSHAPVIVYDLALVKLWRVGLDGRNGRSPVYEWADPMQNPSDLGGYFCGGTAPESVATMKFFEKVKIIHYRLMKKWPKDEKGNYVKPSSSDLDYEFNAKKGELLIGVQPNNSNIGKSWLQFMSNQ